MVTDFPSDEAFESEVRRIAQELFPRARAFGPIKLDGRERDGVYIDGETIHIVEATTSRRSDKASYDLDKSADLVKELRKNYPETNFKIWLVTQNDPTADQVSHLSKCRKKAKCPVEICSYTDFSSKLINAREYLSARDNHPFGSIRKPEEDSDFRVPKSEYISLDLLQYGTTNTLEIEDISNRMTHVSGVFLLVGDYGAGKSMTLRQIYYNLQDNFLLNKSIKFPIYLNLREHFGQNNPSEALLRHGTEIGLAVPSQLVAAWKAGYCHIFLDGFDELSSSRLVRGARRLRLARREAMRLVHQFVSDRRPDTSIFICGREHYFDSLEEMKSALNLPHSFEHYTLNDFTPQQVKKYLEGKGYGSFVPDWLPTRPLLLGYLAVRGILKPADAELSSLSKEAGWDYLLDRIYQREARQIDPISIEPKSVREFAERLATHVRQTSAGRGPIHVQDLQRIFQDVFQMPADEKAETLIFRMPGLTAASGQDDVREFIDDDFVDACRAGDVVRFINFPRDYIDSNITNSMLDMNELGCAIAAYKISDMSSKALSNVLRLAVEKHSSYLSIDILRIMQILELDYVGEDVRIRDALYSNYVFSNTPKLKNVIFEECFFERVEMEDITTNGPKFISCIIGELHGCMNSNDCPNILASDLNEVTKVCDEAHTNADILDSQYPEALKVLLVTLRKIALQKGRGRKENALYRGLTPRAKAYVPDILEIISEFDLAKPVTIRGNRIWQPNKSNISEIYHILNSPSQMEVNLSKRINEI